MSVEIAPDIVVDPQVRFGKPVIKGTRVPVHVILGKLAGGMRVEDVALEYGLTPQKIQAALAYAAKVLEQQEIRALG